MGTLFSAQACRAANESTFRTLIMCTYLMQKLKDPNILDPNIQSRSGERSCSVMMCLPAGTGLGSVWRTALSSEGPSWRLYP